MGDIKDHLFKNMVVNNDQGGDSKVESGCARGMHPLQEVFKSEPLFCSERNKIKPYTWKIILPDQDFLPPQVGKTPASLHGGPTDDKSSGERLRLMMKGEFIWWLHLWKWKWTMKGAGLLRQIDKRQRTIEWRHKKRIVTVPFIQAGQGLASRLEALVSYPHARWL